MARQMLSEQRVPKYFAVKEQLLESIRDLSEGSPLPTERVLAEECGVSRTTVRQALAELLVEGRVYRLQGKGTFVARPKVVQTLALTSYTQDMQARGLSPASRVIAAERLPAFPEVAEMLELAPRTEVLRVQRLRLANLEPMAVETLFVEAARFPGLEERLTDNSSFYELLRTAYRIVLEEAEETIESGIASPSDSQLLGTEMGWPMLLLTRRTWDVEGRPVEFVRSLYRGDRYRFITRLKLVPPS
jgi:GntR family transcriptional regulator, nutrient-sensing system regulator